MSRKPVDFSDSIRKNLAYDNTYGQHKDVHAPHWTGDEGNQAALMRASFTTPETMKYFNGGIYNRQLRNYVTTALHGKGNTIYDLRKFKGEEDFDPQAIEYKTVGVNETSLGNSDMWMAAGLVGAALLFICVTN